MFSGMVCPLAQVKINTTRYRMQQYTLEDLQAAGLARHLQAVQGIAHAAEQELAIEDALADMEQLWGFGRVAVYRPDNSRITSSGQRALHLGDNAHIQVEPIECQLPAREMGKGGACLRQACPSKMPVRLSFARWGALCDAWLQSALECLGKLRSTFSENLANLALKAIADQQAHQGAHQKNCQGGYLAASMLELFKSV